MEAFSFSSTSHFSLPTPPPPFSSSTSHHHHHPSISFCLKPPLDSNNSANFRRPPKPLKTPTSPSNPQTKTPSSNPLKQNPFKLNPSPHSLTNKLWLTSKLSPPPPPPPEPELPNETANTEENDDDDDDVVSDNDKDDVVSDNSLSRQLGKIFVGNLPLWVKKNEFSEFFRQFGPIKNVILIKGHHETKKSAGFGFVIYGGETAENSANKAVEFDGVEFHGRVLTVQLDDGKRLRDKSMERAMWLGGNGDKEEYRSKWHEERDGARKEFQKVLDTEPANWQAVVRAFERIKKPARKEYGLMVKYYARRGDMHHARQTFESMRARGIEPSSHVYSSLIHAYAVGRDMEEALHCVKRMKEEGIEMTIVTYSIIVGGFARVGNAESMV